MKRKLKILVASLTASALAVALVFSPVARATSGASSKIPGKFHAISDEEAEKIAPKDSDPYYQAYLKSLSDDAATASQQEQGPQAVHENIAIIDDILIGSIIAEVVVSVGAEIWKLVEDGKAVFDAPQSTSAAVPKGITSWTQLQGWKPPISKLYQSDVLEHSGKVLEPIYFRLVYEYGGNYKGVGKYLAAVTLMPAVQKVPYLHEIYAKSGVTAVGNVGTKKKPVAHMTLELDYGETLKIFSNPTEQNIIFDIDGDGTVKTSPAADASGDMTDPPVDTNPGATGSW